MTSTGIPPPSRWGSSPTLIRDRSRRNGIILDPFGGSGTTILAAERTGRIARVIELDPLYVDVAIRRWEADHRRVSKQRALIKSLDGKSPARRCPGHHRRARPLCPGHLPTVEDGGWPVEEDELLILRRFGPRLLKALGKKEPGR